MPLRHTGNLDQDPPQHSETEAGQRETGLAPSRRGCAIAQSDSKVGFSAGYSPWYRGYAAS